MNKQTIIIIAGIVLLIAAGLAYVFLKKDDGMSSPASSVQKAEPQQEKERPKEHTAPQAAQAGKYTEYSGDSLAAAEGTKLLFFHAPWCPQCRALEASIEGSELPSGVTIFKVDYDSNQELRAKYGVTIQTTVVKVDDAGNKIASYVAYDEPTFQSVKQALLE